MTLHLRIDPPGLRRKLASRLLAQCGQPCALARRRRKQDFRVCRAHLQAGEFPALGDDDLSRASGKPVQYQGRGFLDGNAIVDIRVGAAVAPAARVQRRDGSGVFTDPGRMTVTPTL